MVSGSRTHHTHTVLSLLQNPSHTHTWSCLCSGTHHLTHGPVSALEPITHTHTWSCLCSRTLRLLCLCFLRLQVSLAFLLVVKQKQNSSVSQRPPQNKAVIDGLAPAGGITELAAMGRCLRRESVRYMYQSLRKVN